MLTPLRYLMLAFFFISPGIISAQSEFTEVPVTTRQNISKKAKAHSYRLQILPRNDSLIIVGYGFQHLTSSLKKFRFGYKNVKINRSQIEFEAGVSLDKAYSALKKMEGDLTYKLLSPVEYNRLKERFLAGGKATPYFSSQWVKLASIKTSDPSNISVRTKGFFRSHHLYTFDYLPGAPAEEFPAIDPWHCQPANVQLFKLRKLQGYGLKKIKYEPYRETSRIILRPSFDVYFPHNEIKPDQATLQNVINYLEDNNYTILNATLEGGCSAEGDSARNLFLQQQRALVLQKALHRYSDALVKKDTVILTNPYEQFRALIKNNDDFNYLDSLSDKRLRTALNTNEKIRNALEPILVLQRKASLKLVVAKRLTREEQIEKFRNDFIKACNKVNARGETSAEAEAIVMGMIEKLWGFYVDGFITESQVEELFLETSHSQLLSALLVYHHLKYYERTVPPTTAITWKTYWKKYRIDSVMQRAVSSLIHLEEFDKSNRKKYLAMLVDFQAYTYEFAEQGLLSVQSLCNIPYPEKPQYMGLILNQYAYLYEKANETKERGDTDEEVYCIPFTTGKKKINHRDSVINTDDFLDKIQQELRLERIQVPTMDNKKISVKKNFDLRPKGAYFFLLKQHYVKNNKTVLENITTTNEEAPSFSIFNLWHFLDVNIARWDPEKNHFYDEDTQLDQLDALITLMKKSDAGLCRPQVNTLYLQYHLKVLRYLHLFAEPGNPLHGKYSDASLKFIDEYYKSRVGAVNARLALYIIYQMNLFNSLPGTKPGAWYAFDLMNALARQRLLNSEELVLYAHYLKLFNPSFKKIPPAYNREELVKLSFEHFKK